MRRDQGRVVLEARDALTELSGRENTRGGEAGDEGGQLKARNRCESSELIIADQAERCASGQPNCGLDLGNLERPKQALPQRRTGAGRGHAACAGVDAIQEWRDPAAPHGSREAVGVAPAGQQAACDPREKGHGMGGHVGVCAADHQRGPEGVLDARKGQTEVELDGLTDSPGRKAVTGPPGCVEGSGVLCLSGAGRVMLCEPGHFADAERHQTASRGRAHIASAQVEIWKVLGHTKPSLRKDHATSELAEKWRSAERGTAMM